MSQDHEQHAHDGHEGQASGKPAAQQQHQPQDAQPEGHAGQGSESALKQMRAWEQDRAAHSGGKGRAGPA